MIKLTQKDKHWLKIGTKIEMEHTKNTKRARKIASDHFAEYGWRYYPALIKMESMLEKAQKKMKK